MAELGSTSDTVALVPGSVSGVADLLWQLRTYGDVLVEAGTGLAKIDTQDGWRGDAADRFHEAYHAQPTRWLEAGDSFHAAATALDAYSSTLSWAQGQAAEAIRLYEQGEHQTVSARATHDARVEDQRVAAAVAVATADPVPPPVGAFHDPGEATREAARELLQRARRQLRDAGDFAQITVAAARDKAPHEPGLLDRVGDALGSAGEFVLHGIEDLGIAVVNGLASYGSAVIHHPGDTAMLVGGLMLMTISGTGEAGGVVLDATGVGAVVGVPLNVVSAAGLVAGATMTAAAAASITQHAMSDDRVEPLQSRAEEMSPGSQGRSGTKTDRIKEHLTDRDLNAAQRELDGEVVARKPDGTPWDHVTEVREAQQGLVRQLARLKSQLGDTRLSAEMRETVQAELSEASRLLDYSRRFVPRGP